MKEKGKKYFPHYKVIPLFPIIKLYHAHKVFAYSDISIVARQSGFSARQWPQIVPFSIFYQLSFAPLGVFLTESGQIKGLLPQHSTPLHV